MADITLSRLHPDPARLTVEEAVSGLRLAEAAPAERPYLVVNFVSTADGKAAVDGRSGPIGDEADSQMFHRLRTQVDAVMMGAGTLRTERYGRLVRDPALREAREREGLAPDPLAVTVTRSLELPWDIPLFAAAEQEAVVFTSAQKEPPPSAAALALVRLDPGELTLTSVLRRLRADHGVRSVLCEGGPTLFGSLLHERLVDELFLTLAPKLAGGTDEPTIVSGTPLPELAAMELVWALKHESELLLRYRLGSRN